MSENTSSLEQEQDYKFETTSENLEPEKVQNEKPSKDISSASGL